MSLSSISSAGSCLVCGRLGGGEGDPSPHGVHQHGGGETRGNAQEGGMIYQGKAGRSSGHRNTQPLGLLSWSCEQEANGRWAPWMPSNE